MAKASGITKKVELSEELSEFMGKDKASRGDVMKAMWVHIKKYDLQDEKNRRTIHPDEVLEPLLGKKPIGMFQMATKLSPHFGK